MNGARSDQVNWKSQPLLESTSLLARLHLDMFRNEGTFKTRGVLIESTIPSYFVGVSLILRRVHFNSETLEILMPGPYKTRTCLARFKWGLQLCEVTILEKTFLLFRMSTLFFKSAGKCFRVKLFLKGGK